MCRGRQCRLLLLIPVLVATFAGSWFCSKPSLADDSKDSKTKLYEIHKKAIETKKSKVASSKEMTSKELASRESTAKDARAKSAMAKEVGLRTAKSSAVLPAPNRAISQLLLTLHNEYRTREGLPPFELHPKLTATAQRYAETSFLKHRFGHKIDGKSPPERISAEGLAHESWAENIALGQQSPYAAMSSWLSSTGHRKNILSQHSHVGFGNVGGVWVAVFANPVEDEDADREIAEK